MKVLITGGAGFIGSNIADKLINDGMEVVTIDDLSNGKIENVNKKAKFYKFDIRRKNLIDIFKKEMPDIVIHNAAQLSVRISVEDPLFDAEVNVIGGLNVFNSSKITGVKKVIFASSGGTVYGEQECFPADESHPLNPISPYGVAKLSSEKYLNYFYENYGMKYIALRYANIYGPRQDPYGEAGVVAIFSSKILKGENPIVNGDGNQTRDYVFIGDVVEVNIKAINCDFIGCINIGTGVETTVNELFNILKNISGNENIRQMHGPSKSGEQLRSVLSFQMAKKILGWEPKVLLEEGLKITYNWFKEHNKK